MKVIPIQVASPSTPIQKKSSIAQFTRLGALNFSALPPLALYVHLPWCVRKCPYCDFNSHENKTELPEAEYLAALRADLEAALPLIWGRPVVSVFIGGGTPSLFSAQSIDTLLADIRARLPLQAGAEITMEANPGTFELEKFKGFAQAGVNRLSVGVQSFNDAHLQALGRIHSAQEAHVAVSALAQIFDNFNLDLMYALPQQSVAQALDDLKTALQFSPPHLSCYHLTLEPNTAFAHHPPVLPDDDTAFEMQENIQTSLQAAGYGHYEVSAYARAPHLRSQHNLNYWQFGDYLGIGAGAHSKLSFPHRVLRQMRHKSPKAYLTAAKAAQANFVQDEFEVKASELPFEFMLNALRLTDGFMISQFAERTGLAVTALSTSLQAAERKGLLKLDANFAKPTELGQRFLNDLQAMFLPE